MKDRFSTTLGQYCRPIKVDERMDVDKAMYAIGATPFRLIRISAGDPLIYDRNSARLFDQDESNVIDSEDALSLSYNADGCGNGSCGSLSIGLKKRTAEGSTTTLISASSIIHNNKTVSRRSLPKIDLLQSSTMIDKSGTMTTTMVGQRKEGWVKIMRSDQPNVWRSVWAVLENGSLRFYRTENASATTMMTTSSSLRSVKVDEVNLDSHRWNLSNGSLPFSKDVSSVPVEDLPGIIILNMTDDERSGVINHRLYVNTGSIAANDEWMKALEFEICCPGSIHSY